MTLKTEFAAEAFQQPEEPFAVVIVDIERLIGNCPGGHVEDAVRQLAARLSRHPLAKLAAFETRS
jgi:hypothetical protein